MLDTETDQVRTLQTIRVKLSDLLLQGLVFYIYLWAISEYLRPKVEMLRRPASGYQFQVSNVWPPSPLCCGGNSLSERWMSRRVASTGFLDIHKNPETNLSRPQLLVPCLEPQFSIIYHSCSLSSAVQRQSVAWPHFRARTDARKCDEPKKRTDGICSPH